MTATKPFSHDQQTLAIKAICDAIIESVREAGSLGAPAGHLYAAMMVHGFTLEQFQRIMGALVRVGELTQRGDCYFVRRAR
jgi:hypothetical protein